MRSSWRQRDLRGGARATAEPESIAALVLRTHRGLIAVRWTESLLFGIAATLLTLAAAVFSAPEAASFARWSVALFTGAFAAASWRLEHRVTRRALVRRLDRKLRHFGGLVTAWEIEGEVRSGVGPGNPMAELLVNRVRSRLRRAEATAAVRPSMVLPVAAPVFACFVLAFAHEARSAGVPVATVDLEGQARAASDRLETVAARLSNQVESGEVDAETARTALRLQSEVRALRSNADELRADPGSGAEDLERLEDELLKLAERLDPGDPLRKELEAARNRLDALRLGLARQAAAADRAGQPDPDPDAARPEAPGDPAGPALASGPASKGTEALAPAGDPGTMSGSKTDPENSGAPLAPGPDSARAAPAEEAGGVGVHWPAVHDALVRAWTDELEQLRTRGSSEPPDERNLPLRSR